MIDWHKNLPNFGLREFLNTEESKPDMSLQHLIDEKVTEFREGLQERIPHAMDRRFTASCDWLRKALIEVVDAVREDERKTVRQVLAAARKGIPVENNPLSRFAHELLLAIESVLEKLYLASGSKETSPGGDVDCHE